MSAVVSRVETVAAAIPQTRRGPAPPNGTLDLLVGICGLWLSAGFLLDSWAHLHIAIESFFTPYHAIFYSAMVAGAIILAVFARRNLALGFTGFDALPAAYQAALWGVPVFFAGGVGDLIWHTFFGIEDRVEAVTSPTHLVIGVGVLLVLSGPIRSALQQRGAITTLRAQLPLLFALATWLEFMHLGTAYGFDPGAARVFAPPNGIAYSPDYFTNSTIVLYKTGSGIAVIMVQSLMMMGLSIWAVTRFRLRPGALTLFFVLGNCMIATALANTTLSVVMYIVMSVVAGVVGDVLIARMRPAVGRRLALGTLGAVVPLAYYGTYFAFTMLTGGFWWSWTLACGSLVWAMLGGLALSLLPGGSNVSVTAPTGESNGAFTTPSPSL